MWTDGVISEHEVAGLADWLHDTEAAADPPGLHFLREEIAGILADGIVSEPEKRLLRDAILRVLPVSERERARARFAESAAQARDARNKELQSEADRATQAQLDYIAALGGTYADGVSRAEASGIIDALLASRPTVRQRMVLRFWNRLDLSASGVDGVSAWMDRWYADDSDRSEAWALWKREAGDQGQRTFDCVERVPLGEGDGYLARVKAHRADATRATLHRTSDATTNTDSGNRHHVKVLLVTAGVVSVIGIVLWLLR